MSEETKKAPAIRFQGFTDDWEQRKLGDIAEIKTGPFGSTLHAEDYVQSGIPIITTEHFKSGHLPESKDGTPQVSDEDYLRLKSYVLKKGDIVFSRVGSVDINALVTTLQAGWLFSGRVLRVRSQNQIDSDYLHYLLDTLPVRNDIVSRAVGQTMPSINTEILKSTKLVLSKNIEEQKLIASTLRKLDDTLALHQRQSNNYKELKKSMLQKMFPQDGEKVPEVRFDGFTEEWERRSLNSIVKRVTRKNKNLESNLPLTISAQHGLVDQNTFFNKQVASKDVSGYYLVKKGEFAYNKSYSSGYPWGAIKRLDNYDIGVLSTLYIVFQPVNIVSDFLVAYYDTNLWHKEVSMRAAEGARNHGLLNISAQDFFETELIISANTEEQARIGSYFKQFDDTIALHQQKITYLQILKNSLLNKMFI